MCFVRFVLQLLLLVGRLNHTSWIAVATPIDRPMSIRKRFLNCFSVFGVVFVLSLLFFLIFYWYTGFRHRVELYFFLSLFNIFVRYYIFYFTSLLKLYLCLYIYIDWYLAIYE